MNKIETIEQVIALISNRVEESTTLEYKSAIDTKGDAWKKELAKDVSAMANANGGCIIYGVKEYDDPGMRYLPEKITPLCINDIQIETLAQVISTNISPRINGIEIQALAVDKAKLNEVVFVVTIPQGTTAHQNVRTKHYHKRIGTIIREMEDYEIRDVMNRKVHPDVELHFEIKEVTCQEQYWTPPLYNPLSCSLQQSPQCHTVQHNFLQLNPIPENVGNVIANYIHYFIRLPEDFLVPDQELEIAGRSGAFVLIRRENIFCDILPNSTPENILFGPPRVVPLLPKMKGCFKGILLKPTLDLSKEIEISWVLHADGAAVKSGKVKLNEITVSK